ncbi:polyprenol phosphomannose-dependent alpha 1,6 mannosyltransferase MptB [Actinoplanes sp. G11-F43]|uniref:polyprenol phosphomannose-dependent alpha 1,6 mannosyltransferase MptB n=1 Tax=Actinoplanes sp. G11-F43 TaxID=3424130 RepID=UPI003D32B51F
MSRPSAVRYLGLAGSLLLAGAAWLGGATDPWEPTVTPRTILAGRDGVLLPLCWLLGTVLSLVAWWWGRRSPPSVRWVWVTAGLWALPLVALLPLGSYDIHSYACQGWQQAVGLNPYGGGVDLLGCPWTDAVAPTWRASPAPYGPVFLVLAAAAAAVGGSLTGTVALLRLIAVLGVVAIAWCLPVLARRAGTSPERASWLFLACPLVPVHLISGAHNEAVMIALILGGLVAATGRRALVAGVLLGLAVGVKATAVVVLPFAVLMVVGVPARVRVAGGAVASLAVVSFGSGLGLGWITGLTGSGVSVQWTAPSTAVGMTLEMAGVPGAVTGSRIAGMVLLVVILVILWFRAIDSNPLRYAGLALAATVVLAPVFHPWYALWPLAVLAVTEKEHSRWLLVPVTVAAALCLPDGYNLALATKAQGAVVMTVLTGYLAWKVLHETNRTGHRLGSGGGGADRRQRAA